MLSQGVSGKHKIQGIGANFVPQNFKNEYCDSIITVSDDDAINSSKMLAKEEGILVGIYTKILIFIGEDYETI